MSFSLGGVVELAPYVLGAITTIWGVFENFRGRNFRRGLELSDQALRTVIAGIEIYGRQTGNEEKAAELKRTIETIGTLNQSEREKLAVVVEDTVEFLEDQGVFDQAEDKARVEAARGVAAMAKSRRDKRSMKAAGTLGVLLVGCVVFSGCNGKEPRLTSEVVTEIEGETWVIVEWPAMASVEPDDYFTTMSLETSRMMTAAPLIGDGSDGSDD